MTPTMDSVANFEEVTQITCPECHEHLGIYTLWMNDDFGRRIRDFKVKRTLDLHMDACNRMDVRLLRLPIISS